MSNIQVVPVVDPGTGPAPKNSAVVEDAAVVDPTIVSRPNDFDAVADLVKEIVAGSSTLKADDPGDEARHDLLMKARTLVQALETPRETMIKHCWAQTGALGGINLGVDSGLWRLMAKNGDGPQKVTDLAAALGMDPLLLARVMRHLAAMGYIKEVGADEYQTTNFAKSLSLPTQGDGYIATTACTGAGPLRFHEYSRKRGYKNPNDGTDTALMYAFNHKLDMFAWNESLGYGAHFNNHMTGSRVRRRPWMAPGFFPVQERLIEGADNSPDATLLVDVGGSVGHDLEIFHNHHPSAPGKLVLQDLPRVIDTIEKLDPAITRMGHDFLTEQPVKGARAYYMHSVLHDWPDEVCATILGNLKAAMKPGYSRLLIHENVIPATGAWWETSGLDMMMLTLFSSRERSEADWHSLLEDKTGLRIVKIHNGQKGEESIIEAELA